MVNDASDKGISGGKRLKILCVFGEDSYGDPARGETHEFANFLPALRGMGHEVALFDSFSRRADDDFAGLNVRLLRTVEEYRPNLIFLVLMNYEIWTETLDLIRAHTPAITLNWGTDDSWKFDAVSRFLAPHLDFHVTTDKGSRVRAASRGLTNVLQSQWATSQSRLTPPLPSAECEFDVSFVGQLYGKRRTWVDRLRLRKIEVAAFGYGSERGVVGADEVRRIFRSSRISLNFTDAGGHFAGMHVDRSRQIKARMFEVTGAGGFLLTEEASTLSDYFRVGEEIDTFANLDQLASKIRDYLAKPELRDRVAQAGHLRTRNEHTYQHRFALLLSEVLSRLPPDRAHAPWTLTPEMLAPFVASHRNKSMIKPLRVLLERPAQAIFGRQRGSRAARRVLFEASWRLLGRRTYSATGLPGRLFYTES